MEYAEINQNGFKIILFQNNSFLIIQVEDSSEEIKNSIKFRQTKLRFEDRFDEYFSNFGEMIQQIKESDINIIIEEEYFKSSSLLNQVKSKIKYLNLKLVKLNRENVNLLKELKPIKIYTLNIRYYLTKGVNFKRINSKPFYSCIEKDNFNLNDIKDLIDNEGFLNEYNIISFKYYNNEKQVFEEIGNKDIETKENIILEFHTNETKNNLSYNLNLSKKYLKEEIIKMKNMINKLSDKVTKYDLIYLYASPIIENDNFEEAGSPIDYMEEIRIISKLMMNSGKKYNCKFECANDEVLRDILLNNKTKILHISGHGHYDGKYTLILENLKKNGQQLKINYNSLKNLLNLNKINISKLDLVFVSTCFSQDFAELFYDYGAKNIIYINGKTEVVDRLIIIFTNIFYDNLIKGYTIKESYEKAMKLLKKDEEALKINFKGCCCNHYHKPNCLMQKDHHDAHSMKKELCKCKYFNPNCHKRDCKYFEEYYNAMLKTLKKNLEDVKKDVIIDIESENNMNKICCCDLNIEHNEILKILYKSKQEEYANISPFKLNGKGKLSITSNISFYYNYEKFISILGRKDLMGRIFNNITEHGNYVILFGEKELEKTNFIESLCVYLCERKVINSYYIFRINSEIDYKYMEIKINERNESTNKKNVKVIKFDNENENINFENLIKIYNSYLIDIRNDLYFIFIFDKKENKQKTENDDKKTDYKDYIENIFKQMNKKINLDYENLFYSGLNEKFSHYLLSHLLNKTEIDLNEDEKGSLVIKAKHRPKEIKKIAKLLVQGKSVEEIINNEITIQKKETIEDDRAYELYCLLSNMPSGLPDCFLNLVFDDYFNIKYNNQIITKSKANYNWKLIIKDKIFYENFKLKKNIQSCYVYFFKLLKLYTILLNIFIGKNKYKMNFKDGNIHYICNSYSFKDIFKFKIKNTFGKLHFEDILNKDFYIHKHKENIINLISFITKEISLIKVVKNEIVYYLEGILLLFPSYFFLEKDNIKILQFCIDNCQKLIDKNINKRFEHLKIKLLLFLYSLDENKNEILNYLDNPNIKTNIKDEIRFLQEIRNKNTNIENLRDILKHTSSGEMVFNIYYEIAINHFKKGNYNECLKNLKTIINFRTINIIKYRTIFDYCYTFIKKVNKEKEEKDIKNNILTEKNNYKLIKEIIYYLNKVIQKPIYEKINYEANYIKREIYNLIEPDIVMLNSNPLNYKSKKPYNLNNQYNILNELKKSIKSHIRIKSDILNKENLKESLNKKGEILIIQSDDFEENNDGIIGESEKGESFIISFKDLINMIEGNEINYKVIILCFPNSSSLKEYFDKNNISYKYLISFDYLDFSKYKIKKRYNRICIQFIINFIKNSINNNNIKILFEICEMQFIELIQEIDNNLQLKNNLILSKKTNKDLKIEYHKEIEENKIYLYEPLPNLENIDLIGKYSKDCSKYVFDLIGEINYKNNKIFHCDKSDKIFFLNISI